MRASLRDRALADLAAAGPPAWVLPHSIAVEGLARAMCAAAEEAGHDVDREVVSCSCILHDIGRAQAQDVRHAGLGADAVRRLGWPEAVALCVERHTGAGIEAQEAAGLGLPARDYVPRTLEERIVAHADNLYTGDRRLRLAEVVAKYHRKGLPQAARRIEALHHALERALDVELDALAPLLPGVRAGPEP